MSPSVSNDIPNVPGKTEQLSVSRGKSWPDMNDGYDVRAIGRMALVLVIFAAVLILIATVKP